MLSETIAELERLEKAATKGPWYFESFVVRGMADKSINRGNEVHTVPKHDVFDPFTCIARLASTRGEANQECDNGAFIAAIRTHAAALLAAAKLSEARARVCEAAEDVSSSATMKADAGRGLICAVSRLSMRALKDAIAALAAAEKGGGEEAKG